MTEDRPARRRRWQFSVAALLFVPLVCAPLFFVLANRGRVSLAEREQQLIHWVKNGVKYPFVPEDGQRVGPGDLLVVVAGVHVRGPFNYTAHARWLRPDGVVGEAVHLGVDAWEKHEPIRPGAAPRIPGLLRTLPPSDPAASPTDREYVAFPVDGYWSVRIYQGGSTPKAFQDLEVALTKPEG